MKRLLLFLFLTGTALGAAAQDQDTKRADTDEKKNVPAVNPGRPTLTDPASLTVPGYLEVETGVTRILRYNEQLFTPIQFKLTSKNNRLQYRLENDGYNYQRVPGGHIDGLGDTNVGLHYLLTRQSTKQWDTAIRGTVKVPTASGSRGVGSGKTDYNLLLLASRDLTPSFHVDANLGYTAVGRPGIGGFDNQMFASLSATVPFRRSRWAYTNEIVYQSPISGQRQQITTMHGFTYANRPGDVWDIAVNFGLSPQTPHYQIFVGRTFFLAKLF